MLYSINPLMLTLLFFLILFVSPHLSLDHDSDLAPREGRTLMSFRETPDGGNVTFDCSPSGPCIPCSRAEKSEENYRCGETGYRIRLKCAPSGSGSNNPKTVNKHEKRSTLEITNSGVNQHDVELTSSPTGHKRLLADSSKSGGGSRDYVTYRSCIPAINEEKLSVLGFEALMFALLISSGSFIYFRRKRASMAGGVPMRLPTSSRF